MADGPCADGTGLVKKDESSVKDDSANTCDLKTISENVSRPAKVKMSFYIESKSDVQSDKCESQSVADPKNSSTDRTKRVEYIAGQEEDTRKKRCADRYDSSESSDSGVAVCVLSGCTDCSGSSGSDITEPGSPYSPSSSSSGCVSEGGPGGGAGPSQPAWPWASKRPRPEKGSTLDSLLAAKLLTQDAANHNNNLPADGGPRDASSPCCALPEMPSARPDPDCLAQISSIPKHIIHKVADQESQLKIQQGRITEYFKSHAKPSNGLKRDIQAWINRATDVKSRVPQSAVTKASDNNFDKYIMYLSQTLNPKVLLNSDIVEGKIGLDSVHRNLKGNVEIFSNSLSQKQQDRKPLPGLNPISNSKSSFRPIIAQKTDVNKTLTDFGNKPVKELKSRGNGAAKLAVKRTRTTEVKKSTALKVLKTKSMQIKSLPQKPVSFQSNGNSNISNKSTMTNCMEINNSLTVSSSPDMSLNSSTPLPSDTRNLVSIHNHMRNIFMKVPPGENKLLTGNLNKSIQVSSENNGVPCFNHQAHIQYSNSNVTTNNLNVVTTQRTENLVKSITNPPTSNLTVPQPTVMLTAIRIPQQNLHQLSHAEPHAGRINNHVNISSPTKINGQFMLPLVQNLNGALVQIPNYKGQNTVLPLSTQNIIQRTDSIVNQQTTQMFINGTILKINGPMHPNLPGLMTKQMTATSTTNVSYTTQKNISTAMPTVMVSKPNFTMNLNHPMFVSSSGFILNPVGSVVTTQTNTGMPQTFNGNVVLTAPVHSNVHMNPNISNNLSGLSMPTCSIPISPLKLGDMNRVFLTPTQPSIPKISLASETVSNTVVSNSQINIITSSVENSSAKVDICVSNSTTKYSVPRLNSIVDTVVSQASPIRILPSAITCSKSANESSPIKANEVTEVTKVTEVIRNNEEEPCAPPPPSLRISRDDSADSISTELDNSKLEDSSITFDESKSSPETTSLDLNVTCETSSIDSPSEASKEIDDESLLTVDISATEEVSTCPKSPILSQPKTIRFPAKKNVHHDPRNRTNAGSSSSDTKYCRWNDCTLYFNDSSNLSEHLQESHVNTQAGCETYTCLWHGCKVYNRPSCSRCWLERHVLSHGGNKLFRCIVDDCGLRFNTQLLLQRHVNGHFTEQGTNTGSAKKSLDNGAPKLIKRNGKKLRYRRQPWTARIFDFFDAGIMEGLQYRLVRTGMWRAGGAAGVAPLRGLYERERGAPCITMAARVLARRLHPHLQHPECLVTWLPPNVLPDEWLPEKDFVAVKDVRMSQLDPAAKDILYSGFCSSYRHLPQPPEENILPKPTPEFRIPAVPVNGLHRAANRKNSVSSNGHNKNTKTDSVKANTANYSFMNNNCLSRKRVDSNDDGSGRVTGAAKRKQGKCYTGESAFRL